MKKRKARRKFIKNLKIWKSVKNKRNDLQEIKALLMTRVIFFYVKFCWINFVTSLLYYYNIDMHLMLATLIKKNFPIHHYTCICITTLFRCICIGWALFYCCWSSILRTEHFVRGLKHTFFSSIFHVRIECAYAC